MELGISDDFWVAVHSGLSQGEQVVMESAEAATTQFGFGGGRFPGGGFTGGFPRGGGFGGGGGNRGGNPGR